MFVRWQVHFSAHLSFERLHLLTVAEILFTAALPVPGVSLALNKNFLSALANVKIGNNCTL